MPQTNEEAKFKDWYGGISKKYGLNPNPDGQFYDYRSAMRENVLPDETGHWPSKFKLPGHPNEFVGGYSTITGKPNPKQRQITDVDELIRLGYDPETARNLKKDNIYSNADLPNDFVESNEPLEDFDASPNNESEELIDFDNEQEPQRELSVIKDDAPDTWMEGFKQSILGGEALDTGLKGAKGFLKGSILDIPETLWSGLKEGFNLATNPIGTMYDKIKSAPEAGRQLFDTVDQAGGNPEEFGRLMGQTTGQPLVTAGLVKGTPGAIRTAGRVIEPAGKVMKRYAPLTGMPVVSPLAGRNLVRIERGIGRGMESVGKKMKSVGKTNEEVMTEPPLEMPLSEGDILPQSKSFKVIRNENPPIVKPRMKPNKDGTFTNLDTGEVVNSRGESIIEIDNKPIDKNSPFFIKNRP
jgi:hypothetical protein